MAPRPRWDNLEPEKRDTIIAAATVEFAENGYDGASLNQILANAGISKGAFYYYFDDKLDLFITVGVGKMTEVIGTEAPDLSADDPDTFWAKLGGYFGAAMQQAMEDPERLAFFKSMLRMPPDVRYSEPVMRIMSQIQAMAAVHLQQGREAGAVRSDLPDGLLLAMVFAVDEALDHWVFDGHSGQTEASHPDVDEIVGLYVDTMRRLLQP